MNMFYVYILSNGRNGTLYVGHTDSLRRRVLQHRSKAGTGFTAKHGVTQLVWFQSFETRPAAFRRERQIKDWRRAWKLSLIEGLNPEWRDLGDDVLSLKLW